MERLIMDYENILLRADPVVLSSVVENQNTPEWVLEKIFELGKIPVIDSYTRANISLHFFKKLIYKTRTSSHEDRKYLIRSFSGSSTVPKEILSFLVEEYTSQEENFIPDSLKQENILPFLASNRALSAKDAKNLYTYTKENSNTKPIVLELAENGVLPLKILNKIIKKADDDVMVSVLKNITVPVEVIEHQFSKSRDFEILSAIAAHPSTPEYILEKLCSSQNGFILSDVAHNPNLPERLYENIIEAGNVRAIKSLFSSGKKVSAELVERIDDDETYYNYIACNEYLSASTLKKIDFNNVSASSVRTLLARPFVDEKLVKRIIKSADSEVRREGYQHHLANIEDVIKAAENDFWAQKLLTSKVGSTNLYRKFYYYIKEHYDLSIEEMPESLIYEMLGWNDAGRRR
jgi:hypothetical protein